MRASEEMLPRCPRFVKGGAARMIRAANGMFGLRLLAADLGRDGVVVGAGRKLNTGTRRPEV
jgi:hypothetical protein